MAGSSEIRAGKAFVEIGGKDKLSPLLEKIAKKFKAFGDAVKDVGLKVAGIGGAGLAALGAGLHQFVEQGHDLALMSKRTGIAVDALSELIALMSPEKVDAFEHGIRHMQKTIVEAGAGSKEANAHLARLGVTLGDLKGLTPDQQFAVFADRMVAIADPTERAGLAMLIFGRAGTEMLPWLLKGSAGLAAMREEARALGLTISKDAAAKASELHHELRSLSMVLKNVAFWVGSAVAPLMIDLAKRQLAVASAVRDWVKAHPELLQQFARISAKVFAIGTGLIFLGTGLKLAGAGFAILAPIVGTVIKALNVKMLGGAAVGGVKLLLAALMSLLNPFMLIGAAIVAGAGLFLYYSGVGGKVIDWLKSKWGELSGTVSTVVGGISDALATGNLALAAQIAWAGLRAVWAEGVAALSGLWNSAWAGIKSIWANATAGLEGIWANFSTWMYNNVPTLTAFIATAFENMWSSIRAMARNDVHFLSEDFLKISQAYRDATPKERAAALAQVDPEYDADQAKIARDHTANLADIARRKQQTPAQRDAELQQKLLDIENERLKALQGINDEKVGAAVNARAEAAKAMAELAALRQQAKDDAYAANEGPFLPGDNGPDMGDYAEAVKKGLSAVVQVGGENLGGLGGGGTSVFDRTAKASEDTAKYTKQIAQAANSGGLAFT